MIGLSIGNLGQIPLADAFRGGAPPPSPETPLKQDLQKVNPEDVGPLHKKVGELRDSADSFVTFVQGERKVGKTMGLETLASEISFVSNDEHIGRFHSALGRAFSKGEAVSLSADGFSKVRRLEGLVGVAVGELDHRLGDPVPAKTSSFNLLIPLVVVGVLGIGTIVAVGWFGKKR